MINKKIVKNSLLHNLPSIHIHIGKMNKIPLIAYCPKHLKTDIKNHKNNRIFAVYAAKIDNKMLNDPHWQTDGKSMCVYMSYCM